MPSLSVLKDTKESTKLANDKDSGPMPSLSVLKDTKESTKLANDTSLLSSLPHGTHSRIVDLFRVNLATGDDPTTPAEGGNQQNLLLFSGSEANTGCPHSESILVIDRLLLWLLPFWSPFSD